MPDGHREVAADFVPPELRSVLRSAFGDGRHASQLWAPVPIALMLALASRNKGILGEKNRHPVVVWKDRINADFVVA
jgi:hypothetical protein